MKYKRHATVTVLSVTEYLTISIFYYSDRNHWSFFFVVLFLCLSFFLYLHAIACVATLILSLEREWDLLSVEIIETQGRLPSRSPFIEFGFQIDFAYTCTFIATKEQGRGVFQQIKPGLFSVALMFSNNN